MTRSEVFAALQAMIADSLAIEPSVIALESRLIDDLGADSLDFVDFTFAIEREFGVNLREADMNFLTRLDFSSPTVMQDGFLTQETIAAIGPLIPALQNAPPGERFTPRQLFSLLTVETLCLMIERKRP
jgi:acyl carrier protein